MPKPKGQPRENTIYLEARDLEPGMVVYNYTGAAYYLRARGWTERRQHVVLTVQSVDTGRTVEWKRRPTFKMEVVQ